MGGQDKGETIKNFLKTLSDNNRLGILQGVCEKFATLMGAARGEMELTVTSAAVNILGVDCLPDAYFYCAETRQQGLATTRNGRSKVRV